MEICDQEARVERRRGGYIKRRSREANLSQFPRILFVREFQQRNKKGKKKDQEPKRSLSRRSAARRLSSLLSRAPTHAAGTTPAAGVAFAIAPSLSSRLAASLRPRTRASSVWRAAAPRGSSKTQVNKLLLIFSIL